MTVSIEQIDGPRNRACPECGTTRCKPNEGTTWCSEVWREVNLRVSQGRPYQDYLVDRAHELALLEDVARTLERRGPMTAAERRRQLDPLLTGFGQEAVRLRSEYERRTGLLLSQVILLVAEFERKMAELAMPRGGRS